MNNVIVGTAGHVDHGKTSLIKVLTGIDTDRLKEEKKRGITIELGFADMPAPDGTDIGIIDVPGHEKFIKNMLAGIGGIDLVLLVVAADEGVMPQTVEHFDILKLLNIKRGIIVITKADLVDEDWLDMVSSDILDMVKGSFLENAEIVAVSAQTGENIEVLRSKIFELASLSSTRNHNPAILRIPIDRVFTIDGFGTVITGTLVEGMIKVGQDITIYPVEKPAKVRNLQVHDHMVDVAYAGQRTAVNLMGIKKEELSRGQVLAAQNSLKPTKMLDVRLDLLKHTKREVQNGSRLHLYYGSDEVLCKVILLDRDVLLPGDSCFAQLRTEENIVAKKRDLFVVRYYSPLETIGGGTILDANPAKRKRNDSSVLESLSVKEEGKESDVLALLIYEQSKMFTPIDVIAKKLGIMTEEALCHAESLLSEGRIIKLSDQIFIHTDYMANIKEESDRILKDYHTKMPLSSGLPKEEFRSKLAAALRTKDVKALELAIGYMNETNVIRWDINTVASTGFQVVYTKAQENLMEEFASAYKNFGHEAPELDVVLQDCKDKNMGKQLIVALANSGKITRLNGQVYIDSLVLNRILEDIKKCLAENKSMTLAELRDLLGTSRKYALQILEYCDAIKLTKLEGESRTLY
ncbi:MAG: selenocysteine-specific translation elongation factor [Clostridia bacterium]|nr:selenocysteine-specific translation elongation factor [Clostridia bacterium]